jgi:uncharacterized membrane protein YhiD involved in acid resistance
VIATMILQSIGDSVASGLGILGALTIINFRTSFRDPRDIIFMFAALGVGIACGSYVFLIAVTGTSIFCFIALVLKFTPFYLGDHLIWELRIRLNKKEDLLEAEKILSQFCSKYNLEAIRNDAAKEATPYHEREYVVILKDDNKQKAFLDSLENTGIYIRRFNLQNSDMTTQN